MNKKNKIVDTIGYVFLIISAVFLIIKYAPFCYFEIAYLINGKQVSVVVNNYEIQTNNEVLFEIEYKNPFSGKYVVTSKIKNWSERRTEIYINHPFIRIAKYSNNTSMTEPIYFVLIASLVFCILGIIAAMEGFRYLFKNYL